MKSSTPSAKSSSTAQRSKRTSPPLRNEAPASVKEMAEEARRAAVNVLTQAKERAAIIAEEQKQSAAQHIGRYGTALRDSARAVEKEDPGVAYFANCAAERIDKVADYVRSTDLDGLRRDAEAIARRHPALFMGGMLLAGVVLGGLIKASAATGRQEDISEPGDFVLDDLDPLDTPDFATGRSPNGF